MKRTIACMLMTVVLILSLSVPAAGELIEYDYPRNTVLLWNADENWTNPDGFVVDTENQTEGEGCVSINFKAGTRVASTSFDAVDATGMLALEFDMYISDLAILDMLKKTQGNVEICSGGNAYHGHMECYLKDIATALDKGCPKTGWNHVIVFLKDMKDRSGEFDVAPFDIPFDISHINYLRIYWRDVTDCGQDWIMKFDNFVLTDREVEPGVPHTPGEWQYDEEKHRRYCVNCGELLGEALHCPEGGCESTGSCKACGLECGPYEHEYALTTPTYLYLASDPTCTEAARIYYCCVRCGERSEETFEFGDPLGHNLTEGYVSCGAEGHSMKCRRCNVYVDVIPHNFSEWVTVREATEAESGLQKRGCMMCSYFERQEIAYDAPNTPDVPETPPTPEQPGEPSDTGCTGVVDGAGLCVVALMLAAGVAFRKKK